MPRDSILPTHPLEHWKRRWLWGIVVPVCCLGFGIKSLITDHSYAIGAGARSQFNLIPVSGFQATLMGIAFTGIAIALFSYGFAPYNRWLSHFSQYGLLVGLLLTATGMLWCSWLMLTT